MKTCCKNAVGRFCSVCGIPLLDKKLSLKRLLELKSWASNMIRKYQDNPAALQSATSIAANSELIA
jgi:hypothetical protein